MIRFFVILISMKTPTCITDYKGDLRGKKVIVRGEVNVPLQDGKVDDDFRIKKLLPTLQYLEDKGAIIILLAHIGRDEDSTLEPVADYLADHVSKMMFYQNFFHVWGHDKWNGNINTLQDDLAQAEPGDIFLLDNVRQTKAEKANDQNLARAIYELGDLYVHEAFPASHRKHMSTYGIPEMFHEEYKFSGITFHMEHQTLTKALTPEHKSVFVLGGAKFETKLPLIESFLPIYDYIIVGGALVNNIYKVGGYEVGQSLVEELTEEQNESLEFVLNHPKFILPEYVTCETVSGETSTKHITEVSSTDKIYDIDPKSFENIADLITNAKTILWNGPLGYYEAGFDKGSKRLAELVGASESYSIAGGGDTIDAIYDAGQEDNFTFLSSAGGAMIDYLADGDLPGVNVLLSTPKE